MPFSKNIFAVSIILFLIIAGLAVYGYFNAVPAGNKEAAAQPKIEITPKSFDFGEVEYGQVVEHIFKVKNLGDEVLEIKKIATSCACTKAKLKSQNSTHSASSGLMLSRTEASKLKAGEEVDLIVTYDTGAMSGAHAKGKQERIIYIKSNDSVRPQAEVVIYAYVF